METNRREDGESGPSESASKTRLRYGQVISPVHTLARRRNKDGKPYISRTLVKQAERLREDYELDLLESNAPIDWLGAIRSGLCRQWQMFATSAHAPLWRIWAQAWSTWRCAVNAGSRRLRRLNRLWAGRRARVKSCCASLCKGLRAIMTIQKLQRIWWGNASAHNGYSQAWGGCLRRLC